MNHRNWLPLTLLLATAQPALGATKETQLPDKEMLQIMEFLREMEMVKQMEMMRELDHVESVGEQAKNSAPPKPSPVKKKEPPK
jgi:hypothetical protein